MELSSRLSNIKRKALKRIEQAAASRDTRLVNSLSALTMRIEEDEDILNKIEQRIAAYESELGSDEPQDLGSILDFVRGEARGSGKHPRSRGRGELGETARDKFLNAGKERGYTLSHISGVLFRTPIGKKVAIPFATEQRPDRWFLGIADEQPDIVVLLCQKIDGMVLEFVLSSLVIAEVWKDLSRSAGQVKFNVSRSGSEYWLVVPKHGRKRVNESLGAYGFLRK